MHYINLFWMGDERGNAIPKQYMLNPLSISIGTQTLHAVGIAWAYKLRREDRVVLSFFGDGATSTGDFHEAMNFAMVMQVPAIFSCMNHSCWQVQRRAQISTASSMSCGGSVDFQRSCSPSACSRRASSGWCSQAMKGPRTSPRGPAEISAATSRCTGLICSGVRRGKRVLVGIIRP